jgi:Arc/MetJ family transcription regulator
MVAPGAHELSSLARDCVKPADEQSQTAQSTAQFPATMMCIVEADYTNARERRSMRTNIEIDDALMAEAQKACGQATKKQTVEQALRLTIRLRRQHELDRAFGKYPFEIEPVPLTRSLRSRPLPAGER